MATKKTTSAAPAAPSTPPPDYLGHPCAMAEARDRFGDKEADRARAMPAPELTRQIARQLNQINDRAAYLHEALELAYESLPSTTDEIGVRSLLALAIPYARDSCDECFDLGGHVIAALERGKLVEAQHD